ncbi:PREDICTED: autophagy-related protein 13 homolog isoform X2 [Ceratosolen solmsi marchali]|uniref:Autophagy-related protein 13 n=1 Tax=Ceratosolen solmsi marchali TaxID=326594 RepID=A0AAJ6YQD9_9HYME|nr:PREDICTED: autophagy-related protein 13 homolog isoform X2 [Ceratosolen solmsi marchali]
MQDKRDLEKFIKFMALKAAQIIIQSRSGDKVFTKCKPNSSDTDSFNLAIQDVPEALTEAKRVLCKDIISSSIPLCIEISLKTIEGDTMVLETWSLSVISEHIEPMIQLAFTIYNRMGILLKSLLSVSRITPAYKLSRRQGSDSYRICYRIYMGEPQLHTLGDNYKHIRVGQLCTAVGIVHLSVSYRTKMTISPTQTGRDTIMLKSDHFHSDLSPKHTRYQQNEESSKSLYDTVKIGAFVVNKQYTTNEENSHGHIPFSSLLMLHQTSSPPLNSVNQIVNATSIDSICERVIDTCNGNEQLIHNNITSKCNSQNGSRRSSCSTSVNEDFIMKTPFAATNTNSDLGTFYRECQSAPQLQAFMEEQTLAQQVGDLTKQLEAFETNMHLYEDLLTSLYKCENNI